MAEYTQPELELESVSKNHYIFANTISPIGAVVS